MYHYQQTIPEVRHNQIIGIYFISCVITTGPMASLLEGVERWLNMFTYGYEEYSPSTIMEGRSRARGYIDRIPYGAYALVYAGTKNTMDSRTIPAIALRELIGIGRHYFMSLDTGEKINGNKRIHMTITDDAINIVHLLADSDGQPWIHDDPFTINCEQNILEGDLYQVGEVINEDEISSTTDKSNSDQLIDKIEENQEIEECTRTTIDQLSDTSTITEDNSEDDMLIDEYSSGTTIEGSDSTYSSSSDALEDIEVSSHISAVNSGDFSFNIANICSEDSQSISLIDNQI